MKANIWRLSPSTLTLAGQSCRFAPIWAAEHRRSTCEFSIRQICEIRGFIPFGCGWPRQATCPDLRNCQGYFGLNFFLDPADKTPDTGD
jgi:hypothetical protein